MPNPTGGVPLVGPYNTASYPLSIPGPTVVSTAVVGSNGAALTGNNPTLALNQSVSAIEVTFDRDMDPTTFTKDDIVRLVGPLGPISDTVTTSYTAGGLAANPVVVGPGATKAASVVISDNFNISDVNVTLSITDPDVRDLTAFLNAPDGVTQIKLFSKVGNYGSPASFANSTPPPSTTRRRRRSPSPRPRSPAPTSRRACCRP
jgi:hypothetical protein